MLTNWLLGIEPALVDVAATATLLLCKLFALTLYRRHNQAERQSRSAAENLWHVRQLTAALLTRPSDQDAQLRTAIVDAPIAVVLHLLRVQIGASRARLLANCEATAKFAPLQSALIGRNTARIIRALETIEVCSTRSCIAAVDRLLCTSKSAQVRLVAAATRQRMGAPLNTSELTEILTQGDTTRSRLHRSIAVAFVQDFADVPDRLLESFLKNGEAAFGIELLGLLECDAAIWRLLVLSGDCNSELGELARRRLAANRQPAELERATLSGVRGTELQVEQHVSNLAATA
jgi:hypothetical protein